MDKHVLTRDTVVMVTGQADITAEIETEKEKKKFYFLDRKLRLKFGNRLGAIPEGLL